MTDGEGRAPGAVNGALLSDATPWGGGAEAPRGAAL